MFLFSTVFLLFSHFISVSLEDVVNNSNAIECPELQEIRPSETKNITLEYTYPPNGTNSSLPKNRKCSWEIFIPNDFFVILYINASVTSDGSIEVVQTPNLSEKFTDSNVEVALLFVFPSVHLFWSSGNSSSDGKLEFNVQWQQYEKNLTYRNYTLEKNGQSVILGHEDTFSPVILNSETKVALLCLPGHRREEDAYLRTIIVYDGPDIRSPCLGSLYSFCNGKTLMKSTNSSVTVYSIVPISTHHHMIVQDISMFANISQISGLPIHGSEIEIAQMNATNGKCVVFTQIDNTFIDEYLVSVELEEGAELQVYFEGLSESQLITSYKNTNNRTHLPQKLQGRVRYYVLTNGIATIKLTRDKWKANWELAFPGRRGFFTSKYWKNEIKDQILQQDSFHFIGNESKHAPEFIFSYRVLDVDLTGDNSLHVVISDNVQRINYYDHRSYDEPSEGEEWISHRGQSISVVYSSFFDSSNGFVAQFEIDSSRNTHSIIVFCFVFLFFLF